jgi:hypothetical protein
VEDWSEIKLGNPKLVVFATDAEADDFLALLYIIRKCIEISIKVTIVITSGTSENIAQKFGMIKFSLSLLGDDYDGVTVLCGLPDGKEYGMPTEPEHGAFPPTSDELTPELGISAAANQLLGLKDGEGAVIVLMSPVATVDAIMDRVFASGGLDATKKITGIAYGSHNIKHSEAFLGGISERMRIFLLIESFPVLGQRGNSINDDTFPGFMEKLGTDVTDRGVVINKILRLWNFRMIEDALQGRYRDLTSKDGSRAELTPIDGNEAVSVSIMIAFANGWLLPTLRQTENKAATVRAMTAMKDMYTMYTEFYKRGSDGGWLENPIMQSIIDPKGQMCRADTMLIAPVLYAIGASDVPAMARTCTINPTNVKFVAGGRFTTYGPPGEEGGANVLALQRRCGATEAEALACANEDLMRVVFGDTTV